MRSLNPECKKVNIKNCTSEINDEFCAIEIHNNVLIITVYRSGKEDGELFLWLFDQLLNDRCI